MLLHILPMILAVTAAQEQYDAVTHQLADFKENTMGPIGILTTSNGAPVEYQEATSTLNADLLHNEHFMDDITGLVRERIPERTVHAGGTGAFGYLEITHDISHICKAKLFSEVGKRTPTAGRFSLSFSRPGAPDTTRELRGFALKFYTEEGNFDLTGLSTPVFGVKDPLLFSYGVRSVKLNPVTGLTDPNMFWDLASLHPEELFEFLYILSDFGMPVGYKHMSAFPIHTYQVYNKNGISSFMKFHILPVAGTNNFNNTGAAAIAVSNPNFYTRDLYNSIVNCEYPKWYLKAQIMSEEDIKNCSIDFFDVTKNIPTDKYPLHPIGIITLDTNPVNHHADIEQLAFCPGNLVPGIVGSPDKVFEARRLSYRDSQNYRLGSNFQKISVNCPRYTIPLTYVRDGVAPVRDSGKGSPNYYPNSFNGPVPIVDKKRPSLYKIHETPPSNSEQIGEYYESLNLAQRNDLVENILTSLCFCEEFIKTRIVERFTVIHCDLANRVSAGLAQCTS